MDEKKWNEPIEIPSPDELFHPVKSQENASETNRSIVRENSQVQIPSYKVEKLGSAGFIAALVLIIAIAFGMNLCHIQLYCMKSDSMERVIAEGSLVVVRPLDPFEVEIGDIISFRSNDGKIVTHEVVAIEENTEGNSVSFRTKGTENKVVDRDLVLDDQVKGKVMFHIPYIGGLFNNGVTTLILSKIKLVYRLFLEFLARL